MSPPAIARSCAKISAVNNNATANVTLDQFISQIPLIDGVDASLCLNTSGTPPLRAVREADYAVHAKARSHDESVGGELCIIESPT